MDKAKELEDALKDMQAVVSGLTQENVQLRYQFTRANRLLQETQAELATLKKPEEKKDAAEKREGQKGS